MRAGERLSKLEDLPARKKNMAKALAAVTLVVFIGIFIGGIALLTSITSTAEQAAAVVAIVVWITVAATAAPFVLLGLGLWVSHLRNNDADMMRDKAANPATPRIVIVTREDEA